MEIFALIKFSAQEKIILVRINPAGKYWSPGRPPPKSPGRPLKILFDRPGDVPI